MSAQYRVQPRRERQKVGGGTFSSEVRVPSAERLLELLVEDLGPRL